MIVTRLIPVALCAAALLSTGCRNRESSQQDVATAEQRNEILRLSSALERQQEDIKKLTNERDDARRALEDARATGVSTQTQLEGLLKPGDNIAGVYALPGGGIALDEDFAFAKGSAELNEAGAKTVGQLAQKLNSGAYANAKVVVEGHTDDTPVSRAGTKEKYHDNWGLSAARAAEVIRALEKANVSANRLYGAFRGEHEPRPGAKDKAANRRVELHLR